MSKTRVRGERCRRKASKARNSGEKQLAMFGDGRHGSRWGGKREGAGAKPKLDSGVPHDKREAFNKLPVHVTMKIVPGVMGLRHVCESEVVREVLRAARTAKACEGVRFIHYSIQWDHLHVILEPHNEAALTKAMHSLTVRLARALNRLWKRKGPVFADRYHAHVLKCPTEARNVLRYVLNNARKHRVHAAPGPDPLSSGATFRWWLDVDAAATREDPCVEEPTHWLLTEGWLEHCERFTTKEIPPPRSYTVSHRKQERRRRRKA